MTFLPPKARIAPAAPSCTHTLHQTGNIRTDFINAQLDQGISICRASPAHNAAVTASATSPADNAGIINCDGLCSPVNILVVTTDVATTEQRTPGAW